uniref:SHSP domain-containing protein n=1 Tax=Kalanchoe fedtschenkoi TaxID=63787 RepID=A0A7N0VIP9_KALFE
MAQSISALNAALPLSSDRSTFMSKPIPSTLPKSFKLRAATPGSLRGTVSMAGEGRGGDLDHLQRAPKPQQPKRRVEAAPVGVWDRFPTARTVQQMMETMDRMMEDPLAYTAAYPPPPPPPPTQNGRYSGGRTPWEIKEGESEYKMRFDMPGMTREDVRVWVEEKMLVVQAEKAHRKKQDTADNGSGNSSSAVNTSGNAVVVEEEEEEWPAKSYGRYRSRILLPENIQFEKIKAEVKDGVLYITIPKATVSAKVLDIAVQ